VRPPQLDLAQHIEQFRWFEFGNRTPTNRWKNVHLQTPEDLTSVIGSTSVLPVVVPFAGYRFEGIARGDLGSAFALALNRGRIDVSCQAALGIVASNTCLHKADGRIDAERKRPLLSVPSKRLRGIDDSFLLGSDLLVAVQVDPVAVRNPILPKGIWRQIGFPLDGQNESGVDIDTPNLPRLYVRGGAIVPTGPVMQYTGEKPLDPVTLLVCLDDQGKADGTLYEDAGDGFDYLKGAYRLTTYHATEANGHVEVTSSTEGNFPPSNRLDHELSSIEESYPEEMCDAVDGSSNPAEGEDHVVLFDYSLGERFASGRLSGF
jgi:hypothetical protein